MAGEVTIASATGITWVYQCNRSSFEPIRERAIRQEVTLNAGLLGEYARLVREGSRMRVIAGHSEGYPLGEAVRDFFPTSRNFVWCEEVAGGDCLLVIVVRGEVATDSCIPPAVIDNSAMEPIALSEEPFDFFVYGSVPIARPGDIETDIARLRFESSLINSFTVLDAGILDQLTARPEQKLLPVKKALAAADFGVPKGLIAAGVVLAGAAWIFSEDISKELGLIEAHQEVEYVDPYQEYRNALSSPLGSEILLEAYGHWFRFEDLAEFRPVELTYSNGQIVAKLERAGTDPAALRGLDSWAGQRGWHLQITGEEAILSRPSVVGPRSPASTIASISALSAQLVDEMGAVIGGQVSLTNAERVGAASRVVVSGKVGEASVVDLRLLSIIFDNPHTTLNSLRLANPVASVADIDFELTVLGNP